jgi:signal transduction histidine kinase
MSATASRATGGFSARPGGRWQRHWRRARALGPAYFSVLVRWTAWGSALVMVLLAGTPGQEGYFVLTFLQTVAFTAGYFLLHGPLREVLRRPAVRRIDGRALWAAADLLLSLGVMAGTGGPGGPFRIYGLTAVMFPALVFRWRGAVIAATTFGAFQLLDALAGGGLAALQRAGQVDNFVSAVVDAYLVALFTAYLATLLRSLETERRRTAQAWRETSGLYAVAQSVLDGPPDRTDLYARVVGAVQRHLRLSRFGIYVPRGEGQALVAGYGLPASLVGIPAGCIQAPLTLEGQEVGQLVAAPRGGEQADSEALLRAVAVQVVLGLRNAELTREKATLAAAEERARLAREIHDGVAQSLYMLTLNLDACVELSERVDGLRPRLEQLLQLARQALWEVRHYIFDLKPLLGGDTPLAEVLRNPLREFESIANLPAELKSVGVEQPLPLRTRAAVYRALQEALANAFKHARASRVSVVLRWTPSALTLEVADDGRGFDVAAARPGHGLLNLRQRAAEVGGVAEIASAPNAGTRVTVTVPYTDLAE